MCEEALQIAEKGREAEDIEERGKYTQLNAEFQRIARRDKKAFFSEQCKEVEEKSRKGKTRDLFRKIGGTFLVVQGLRICLAMQEMRVHRDRTKIPHAVGQLSPWTTTRDPTCAKRTCRSQI